MGFGAVDVQRLDMPGIPPDRLNDRLYITVHLENKLETDAALRGEFFWRPVIWCSRDIYGYVFLHRLI